ncbi:MAG: MFS transporter [Deltaproteobacteria bacterium]|nr:MFS transporter [Deltaproteobacteria bacterium]
MFPALSESPRLRILTLCLLYLAQGLPWGFVTYTLAAWFAEQGMGTAELGAALGITSLPWSIKFLWGPVIDRWTAPSFGRRRPWILLAQGLMFVTVLGILAVPDLMGNIKVLVGLLFLHNCFAALQDVAVDALAVDLLEEKERGTANGLMYGSKYLGGGLGGAGLSKVMAASSLTWAILAQGVILAVIFLFPLFLRERPRDRTLPFGKPLRVDEIDDGPRPDFAEGPQAPPSDTYTPLALPALLKLLLKVFRLRSPALGAAFALVATMAAGGLGVIATVFFVQELGWGDTEYAEFAGGPALGMGLGGAIFGGWLADKIGRKPVVIGASVLLGVSYLAFAAAQPYWDVKMVTKGFLLAEPLFMSIMAGGLFALCMDLSLPAIAATQFTAYMALSNLSSSLGQMLGGQVGEMLSYPTLFAGAGVVQILVALLIVPIRPLQAREELGQDGSA